MPHWGATPTGGVTGPFLGTFTGLTPPSPDTYKYPGWALDANGRVWLHLGPNLWTLSLSVGGAYAPGQGGAIPSAKGTSVLFDGVSGQANTPITPALPLELIGLVRRVSDPGEVILPIACYNAELAGAIYADVITSNLYGPAAGNGVEADNAYGLPAGVDTLWHWVDVILTATELSCQVDDNAPVTSAFTAAAPTSAIFFAGLTAVGFFNCYLERWAIFSGKTISAQHRTNLYVNYEGGSAQGYDAIITDETPTAYYLMQETVGSGMLDSSGNGNRGAYGGGFTLAQPGGL